MKPRKAFTLFALTLPLWPQKAGRKDEPRTGAADTAQASCRACGPEPAWVMVSSRRSWRWLRAWSHRGSRDQSQHPHRGGAGGNRSSRAHSDLCLANRWDYFLKFDSLLLVYRNGTDFFILILDTATLLTSLIRSNSFWKCLYTVFYKIMSSANRDSFTSSFTIGCLLLFLA